MRGRGDRFLGRIVGFAVALLAAGVLSPIGATAQSTPVQLTPGFGITLNLGKSGGEPSIQDDGHGHVYISSPVGTGSVQSTGVRLSRSIDGGTTFKPVKQVGGVIGGADSDVTADVTGANVWIADLAAAFTNVLHSTDLAATFPNNTTAGGEADREWLTPIGSELVLTYHDFSSNLPFIWTSSDGGGTFTPAGTGGQIIGPADPGFADSKCNTLVGKPVTDAAGTLYVLTNTSTAAEDIQAGQCALAAPLDRFYLSISKDGGHTFTTRLISDISLNAPGRTISGSYGYVFNQLGIDAGGNLYIAASMAEEWASSGPLRVPLKMVLLVSKDHGVTFSKPHAIFPSTKAQIFPAIAVGQAGQLAVGYYSGLFSDHQLPGNKFQFYIDETTNALAANPSFTHTQLTPIHGTSAHPDGFCTVGVFCTSLTSGGNRHLADFESMTVDPTGHLEVVIPADEDNKTTENWYYKQTTGLLLVPGATNGNGTGNQTYVSTSRTNPPPSPSPRPGSSPSPAASQGPVVTGTGTGTPGTSTAPAALWRPLLGGGLIFLAIWLIALRPGRRGSSD